MRRRKYERVERIEKGNDGERGKPGDPGPPGPPGAVVHDEQRERNRDRKALIQAVSVLALPVAIIALIPSLYGLHRVQANQEQLEREIDLAVEKRRETTYALCLLGKTTREELRAFIIGVSALTYKSFTVQEQQARERFFVESVENLTPIKCIKPGGKPAATTP